MPNDRLREAMRRAGHSYDSLAAAVGVDAKSVERWVSCDRVPHARNRLAAGRLLNEADTWLWPETANGRHAGAAAKSELVQLCTRRSMLGAADWMRLFSTAASQIDLLAYASLFLPEQLPTAIDLLRVKARDGVPVRVLLGEPNSAAVRTRGVEEGIGDAVSIKVQNALSLLRNPLGETPNITVRLHGTTLYTSIYRADDEMIANPHVIGLPAGQAPALQLRRVEDGGVFDTYAAAYERVWMDAKPAWT